MPPKKAAKAPKAKAPKAKAPKAAKPLGKKDVDRLRLVVDGAEMHLRDHQRKAMLAFIDGKTVNSLRPSNKKLLKAQLPQYLTLQGTPLKMRLVDEQPACLTADAAVLAAPLHTLRVAVDGSLRTLRAHQQAAIAAVREGKQDTTGSLLRSKGKMFYRDNSGKDFAICALNASNDTIPKPKGVTIIDVSLKNLGCIIEKRGGKRYVDHFCGRKFNDFVRDSAVKEFGQDVVTEDMTKPLYMINTSSALEAPMPNVLWTAAITAKGSPDSGWVMGMTKHIWGSAHHYNLESLSHVPAIVRVYSVNEGARIVKHNHVDEDDADAPKRVYDKKETSIVARAGYSGWKGKIDAYILNKNAQKSSGIREVAQIRLINPYSAKK